ncbi:hypothetical protein KY359_05370 [Candidatus Woesearchaeota archaeon]|nr:hypothetical protein [Candidatus Woesearchaeota archaeon]
MAVMIERRKRALFFTIDALIAALIMIAGLLMMTSSYVSEQPKTMINTLSQDLLNILSELQVWEVNNSFIQELYENGSITDLNSTLLEQIGEFWADENVTLAAAFAENVSEGMLDTIFGYSIIFDNDTIYTRANPVKNSLVTSKKIITGIQKSKPVKGYIAKARATTVSKTTSLVVPYAPAGAGWKGSADAPGVVQVLKYFELPDVSIINASLYLSLHLDRGSPDWDIVTINEGACVITRDDMDLAPGSEGVFRIFQLNASCFGVGNNSISLDLRNLGYNAHIHPGTFLIVNYNQSETPETLQWEHSERLYFDNVNSTEGGTGAGAGPWVIRPFHIPTEATNISVSIQVAGRGVRDYTASCTPSRRFYGWGSNHCMRDYDYIVFLNSDTPFDSDDSPSSDPVYTYSPSQTADHIINGTNLIAVYFNNYEDSVWGEDTEIIYSDPVGNASGSSYVEVNYSSPPALPYGVIEIRRVEEFGGVPNYTKDTNFSFPVEAEGVSSVFVHPVELYSYITEVYSDTGYPPGNLVFQSPSSRAVPSDIYVPLWTLDKTPLIPNYERIVETSWNEVLPNSTIDYGFYIKGFVGYGQVFATWDEAIEDAVARLQDILGTYVNASDLLIENTTMSGVPSLWGPAVSEVRVWD